MRANRDGGIEGNLRSRRQRKATCVLKAERHHYFSRTSQKASVVLRFGLDKYRELFRELIHDPRLG